MSKVSVLKTAPLYLVCDISFPALMMEASSQGSRNPKDKTERLTLTETIFFFGTSYNI
jgi:hypothetical protein